MKKTWQEKMADKKNLPKILTLEKNFPCYNAVHKMGADAGDRIILVNPSEVMDIMKRIPNGKIMTLADICKTIAKKHKVKGCCSLTTGIFVMTIANAVEEMKKEGKRINVPWWRTVKADGTLNEKYPGGAAAQKKLLEKERWNIVRKGKKYLVII
ncbi:MGMT family protein [bacterium]|nr:MGMT family protein [bacterium]